ncbi:sugar phosphate isomerase/epimerase [Microbacterium sp. K24]|uniref:sugar phosphate isomerase/epimerase family protein n=1 Tax=Microbacterium sp. K24 TaxID=2305446 RepID=UPI00109D0C10|nr:sugar phosphate isomerase/epimerase [Microbacterium sp. K24]
MSATDDAHLQHSRPNPRLLASCWTWSGPAGPGIADERSPIPIEERLDAIVQTGWRAVGFAHADLLFLRKRVGYSKLRAMLSDAGIERVEVEFLSDWWAPGERGRRAETVAQELFEAAAELGSPLVKLGATLHPDYPREPRPLNWQLAEGLATAAGHAEQFNLDLAFEALSGSHVESVSEIVDIVDLASAANTGIVLDLFHMARAGESISGDPKQLRGSRLLMVELGDAPRLENGKVGDRCLPGEGDLDIEGFISAVLHLGWDGWWGVEIISEALRQLPIVDGLTRVREGILRAFPT